MADPQRTVRHLHLQAPSPAATRRAVLQLEDALRCASLPDGGRRRLFVRRLDLGRLDAAASPQAWSLGIERALARADWRWVEGDAPGAGDAAAVWFRDALHALLALALRLARGPAPTEWFWPHVLPGWRPGTERRAALAAVVRALAALPEAAAALPAWIEAMAAAGQGRAAIDALQAADDAGLPPVPGLRRTALGGAVRAAAATPPGAARLPGAIDPAGDVAALQSALRPVQAAAPRPAPQRAGPPAEPAAGDVLHARATLDAGRAGDARATPPSASSGPGRPTMRRPLPAAAPPPAATDGGDVAAPDRLAPLRADDGAAPARAAVAAPSTEVPRPAGWPAALSTPHGLPGFWPWADGAPTEAAGALFLVVVLQRIGFADWMASLAEAGRRPDACIDTDDRHGDDGHGAYCSADAAGADDRLGSDSAGAPERATAACTRALWRAALGRLRVPATDAVWALARLGGDPADGALPVALDRDALARAEAALRRVGSHRAAPWPDGSGRVATADEAATLWLALARRWLRRRAGIGLASLVRRPGWLCLSATHADVVCDLDAIDLRVRRAGLDIDPGWVPWLGRVVGFHYERLPGGRP